MGVGWAAAVLRPIIDVGGVLTVGALVAALFLLPSDRDGALSGATFRALRTAGCAAAVWAVALAASTVVGAVLWSAAVATGCAVLVAVGSAVARRWLQAAALLGPAGVALLLPLAGESATAGPQGDLVGGALVGVLAATAAWAGALLGALLGALRREHGGLVLRRFGRIVAACWPVLAAGGAVLAATRGGGVGPELIAGAAALAALGGLALAVRRRVARTAAAPAGPALVRLLGAQVALLLVLIVVVGRVSGLPAPTAGGPLEAVTGYPLPDPPTWDHLLSTWRPDLLLGPVAVLAAIAYLAEVRRLHRAGRTWPPGRTAAWLAGCALVLLATSSGLGAYAPALFSVHMVLHMVLNMVAPLALVLGAPVTLALRALPIAEVDGPAGPHEWLLALTGSPLARVLAHPLPAAALFAGSYYLLYLTGLFDTVIAEHWSRTLLNVAILVIGYQFCWLVVGPDAAPRRLPHIARLGLGFTVMPFHVLFAIVLISLPTPVAAGFYAGLDLPWSPDLLADQRLAGLLSLVFGEAVLVATLAVLLVQWHRHDQFAAFRSDPLDEDAAAYRDLLATLERRRRPDDGS